MFAKIETIDQAASEGKHAVGAAIFLLMVTVFESIYDIATGDTSPTLLLFTLAQIVGLTVVLWQVWPGTSALGAAFLLPWSLLLLALTWRNAVWVVFCLWALWEAAQGLRASLIYQRLVREIDGPPTEAS